MAQYLISYILVAAILNMARKYVVYSDNMLMESLFDVGEGLRSKKNLVSDCPGGHQAHELVYF